MLIVQQGGGLSLPRALEAEAAEITLPVELPKTAALFKAQYQLPNLKIQHDLIQVENWGASIPGMAGLNHEHLFTVEALAEYLLHLKERGILIISRKLHLPPSDSLKFYAAAFQVRKSRDV